MLRWVSPACPLHSMFLGSNRLCNPLVPRPSIAGWMPVQGGQLFPPALTVGYASVGVRAGIGAFYIEDNPWISSGYHFAQPLHMG